METTSVIREFLDWYMLNFSIDVQRKPEVFQSGGLEVDPSVDGWWRRVPLELRQAVSNHIREQRRQAGEEDLGDRYYDESIEAPVSEEQIKRWESIFLAK